MPTCGFCGGASPPGQERCEVCGSRLDVIELPEIDRVGWSSPEPKTKPGAPPPPGVKRSGPPSYSDAPPPGWGTASSTSWGQEASAISRVREPTGKKRRRGSSSKALRSYLRLGIAVAIIAAVALFIINDRASKVNIEVTLVTSDNTSIAGTVYVKDEKGATLTKALIDTDERCGSGRRAKVKLAAERASEYVFEYRDTKTMPMTSADLTAAGNRVTVQVGQGGPPSPGDTSAC